MDEITSTEIGDLLYGKGSYKIRQIRERADVLIPLIEALRDHRKTAARNKRVAIAVLHGETYKDAGAAEGIGHIRAREVTRGCLSKVRMALAKKERENVGS